MKKKQEQTTADQAPIPTEDDLAFERELMAKFPDRKINRFEMPAEVEECTAVYMFKMRNRDEIIAAEEADAMLSSMERKSQDLAALAHHRSLIRTSIAGIVTRSSTGGIERRLIDQSRPLLEINNWDATTWSVLNAFYMNLNTIPKDSVGNGVRGTRRIGGPSAP